ncbi:MalY/PatB family protein [Lapillicoccus jejuensis]|uniref:cysteine-S-conjugate beta-lyase n=1 Tax=Lapillicoccus jejuensis TaxID=402171 RepID=A0A542DZ07_9MICO|nr:aminotransferase class I/II-fold pyridoxal phosphate-dependent enzyme [Lapillicoccus jejuensis]TQJ08286.1 cystathionine beta-lyase [Lapillicoccus jejuensis]
MTAAAPTPASTTGVVDLDALTADDLRARGTAKWSRYPADVIPLWVAEMDFPTAPVVLDAVRRALDRESLGYPLDAQRSGVADALAGWYEREHGWALDPARIVLVPNVVKGVGLALETVCADAPVVIPTPAYMPFFDVVHLRGLDHVPVPMVRAGDGAGAPWSLDLPGIDAALAAGARTVILCQPHNPLGHVHTREELLGLADVVERHGARVVSDEIHAPLVLEGRHLPYAALSAATARHTVTVVSASKAWNVPGLTCAQLVTSNDDDQEAFSRLPHEKLIGVGTLGIAANVAAYEDGGPWMAQVRERLDANRLLVAEAVASWPGVEHRTNEATYLAWLDLTGLGLDEEPAAWLLREARVALNDGVPFGAPAHRFARLNYATTAPLLDEALTRIGRAVARRG